MKTAVEWLVEQIEQKNNGVSNGRTYPSIFEQAKEMEKHQQENIISETWVRCVCNDGSNFKETRDKIMKQFKRINNNR